MEPSINLRGEYSDNYRLAASNEEEVWSLIADPRLSLSRNTPLLDLGVTGRLRASTHDGGDIPNRVNKYLDLSALRRFERGSLNTSLHLVQDTTLQNETLDLDTGLTTTLVDRRQYNLALSGQYMLTQRTWTQLSVNYRKNDYKDGEPYGLLDFDSLSPSLTLSHQYTSRLQLFGTLSHSTTDYDSPRELESKTLSLQAGANYDITETWRFSGSLGSRRTRSSSLVPTPAPIPGLEFLYPSVYQLILAPRDSETTGLVYNMSLTREFETGEVSLAATRSVSPSSTGTDTDTTSLSIAASHGFSAKLSGRIAVSFLQSETIGGVTTAASSDRYRVSPGITWKLDRDLVLNAGYRYTRVKRNINNDDIADSNHYYISVGYSWPRVSVSR